MRSSSHGAAPSSSSGLVPLASSKRDLNEYALLNAPFPKSTWPLPHSLTLPTQRACGSHVDGSFSTPPKIHSWRPPPHRRSAALLLAADDLAVRQRLFLTMLGNRNPDRAQRRSGYRSWQKWRERHGRRARTYRSLVLHENLRSDKSMDRRALRLKVCFAGSARRDGRLRA